MLNIYLWKKMITSSSECYLLFVMITSRESTPTQCIPTHKKNCPSPAVLNHSVSPRWPNLDLTHWHSLSPIAFVWMCQIWSRRHPVVDTTGCVPSVLPNILAWCRVNVGPSSSTLAQPEPYIGPLPRVCWDSIWYRSDLGNLQYTLIHSKH